MMRTGLAGGMVITLAIGLSACAKERAPSETSSATPPAPSGAAQSTRPEAPSGGVPVTPRAELPTSLHDEVTAMDLATATRTLADSSKLLGDTLQQATPDCGLARTLRDRICELSLRICHLADDVTVDPKARAFCSDGRSRCEQAKTRVTGSCG